MDVKKAFREADEKQGRMDVREAFSKALVECGKKEERVVVLSADVEESVGAAEFGRQFPERFFNVGIAEQNVMGISAGLAYCGKIPFCCLYSFFATMRCCDQVKNDVAYPNANVKIVGARSGVSFGTLGTTHHDISDIAIMRSIPNMTVLVPADDVATREAVLAAVEHQGPVYIRLGGKEKIPLIYGKGCDFRIGKAITIRDGKDATIIATGLMLGRALDAAEELEKDKIDVRVIDMHTIKPIDEEVIQKAVQETKAIITIEEHNYLGGLGGAVAEVIAGMGTGIPLKRLGIPDTYCRLGTQNQILEYYGLTTSNLIASIKRLLNQ